MLYFIVLGGEQYRESFLSVSFIQMSSEFLLQDGLLRVKLLPIIYVQPRFPFRLASIGCSHSLSPS